MANNEKGSTNGEENQRRTYNLLVYGIEKVGLTGFKEPLKRANFTLTFAPYDTPRRFNDFDGVILFQGIFEKVVHSDGGFGSPYVSVERDKDQIDKRLKELQLLLEKGGFACFILCKPFVDEAKYGMPKSSDLVKICLNIDHFYRENFGSRIASIDIKRNEFTRFLKLHGAASSYFKDHNFNLDLQPIAMAADRLAGFIIFGASYYVPALIPDDRAEKVEEYFDLLADALTATANKLAVEIPEWIDAFRFSQEKVLVERKAVLEREAQEIEEQIGEFQGFKRVLIGGDDPLVADVANVLRKGFGFLVEDTDEYREDLKIVNEKKEPQVFVEVKGINAGVKLEHVNQADSHRERAGLPPTFPAILIANTNIKNARKLDEKDKPIGGDQIERAVKIRVLILRTLDLIALLQLMKNGALTPSQVLDLFKVGGGWLRVWGNDKPEIIAK